MKKSFLSVFALVLVLSVTAYAEAQQLNVYSFRKYELIKPVIQKFEHDTGIQVNLVNGKSKYLLSRLEQDGAKSQADVILSSDLVQLHDRKSLLQPISNKENWHAVPDTLKDSEDLWISISMRTRALFTAKSGTSIVIPKYYSQLQSKNYLNSFCIRDWQHSYNVVLAAGLLSNQQSRETAWLKKGNALLAKRPSGGDRDQLRALAKGQCQFALANHYYWDLMKRTDNKRDRDLASKLHRHFLKTQNGYTPVSTTSAAIAKYAPNKANAEAFISFLLTPETQLVYAQSLHEYPVLSSMMSEHVPFKPNLHAVKESLTLLAQAKAILPK